MFCFGTGRRSPGSHAELEAKVRHWRDSRPDSFDPYYVDEGRVLPDIRFTSPWHGELASPPHKLEGPRAFRF